MSLLGTTLRWIGAYWIYEKWLTEQVKKGDMPRHVSLILDGNRRWAERHKLQSWVGHEQGSRVVGDLLDWCLDLGIETVTLYALSTENLRRSPEEVKQITDILRKKVAEARRDPRIREQQVRITALGRIDLLPPDLRVELRELERETKGHDRHFLNVAVAYGGRAEIVDAVRKISEKAAKGEISSSDIDEELVEANLYTAKIPDSDPDLIIRTSGEERISNFLLWQSAYSEFVFLDVYWPAFRKIDLLRAIRTYQHRSRRIGL
ncbi:MAG: polyprenyl diphosphate synthase [Aigarchaeota archaeon]|nr:polyprenyl diphosphate synthase [Aigarchaeota archaeon]MDH5703605.1 polyprenyl diphosphate synthase [Aigarchaeota archaeon]